MSDFTDLYNSLTSVISKFEDVMVKMDSDMDNDIIKIYGKQLTPLGMAKNGLRDVTELSVSTAEHHPYWNLIYQCCQICSSALEKWNDQLSTKDLDEIRWSISELSHTCAKLQENIKEK